MLAARFGRTLALAALALALAAAPTLATATVGAPAPGFQLKDFAGKTRSLADYKGKVVVLEWINPNCPYSNRHAREKTMVDLAHKHGQVVWLAINSTNPHSGDYLEPAEHLAWNRKNGIDYAVLYDSTGQVGKAYGAKTTPHMFIIDPQGKVAYNGAIDDDPSGREARPERTNYVDLGLIAEAAHRGPDPTTTKPYGCSVKY